MPTTHKWQVAYTLEEARAISKKHIRELADTIPTRLAEMRAKKKEEYV